MGVTQAPSSESDYSESAPGTHLRASRLIGSGLAWLIAALLAPTIVQWLMGFLIGFGTGLVGIHLPPTWFKANAVLFLLVGGIGLQSVLLAGSLRRGRLVGSRNQAVGLGMNPIDRPFLVTGLVALLLCCQIGVVELTRHLGVSRRPVHHIVSEFQLAVLGLELVLFIALAPVAEELFFRGWLWVGLRRVWGTVPVMIVTAMAWLGLHVFDGLYRPVLLIPFAVLLTIIRYVGCSVRASIAGHVAGNALVFSWMIIESYGP